MVSEVEKHIEEAGSSTPISVSADVEEAGVTTHHEDALHSNILKELAAAHPEITIPGAAHPISTEPTPNLVRIHEPKVQGSSFKNTSGWLRLFNRKKNEQKRTQGGLPNAA